MSIPRGMPNVRFAAVESVSVVLATGYHVVATIM